MTAAAAAAAAKGASFGSAYVHAALSYAGPDSMCVVVQ